MKHKPQVHQVYTDSSCTQNPGGKGAYVALFIENGTIYHETFDLFEKTNSPRMEVMGIHAALKFILHEQHELQNKYQFFSDSEYVVRSINEWMKGWARAGWNNCGKKNIDLWHEIYYLWDSTRFSIKWIRGHNGNQFNELADQFCTEVIRQAEAGEIKYRQDYWYDKNYRVNEEEIRKKYPQGPIRRKRREYVPPRERTIEEIQAYIREEARKREERQKNGYF